MNDSGSAICASHCFFHNFAAARAAFRPRIMLAIRKDGVHVTCRNSTRGMCHRLQLASTSRTQERHSSSHLRFRDSSLFPSFFAMTGQPALRLGDFMFFNVSTSDCASGSMGLRKRPIAGCPGPTFRRPRPTTCRRPVTSRFVCHWSALDGSPAKFLVGS